MNLHFRKKLNFFLVISGFLLFPIVVLAVFYMFSLQKNVEHVDQSLLPVKTEIEKLLVYNRQFRDKILSQSANNGFSENIIADSIEKKVIPLIDIVKKQQKSQYSNLDFS